MTDDGIVVISRNQLQELLDDKVARLEDMIERCINILQSIPTEQQKKDEVLTLQDAEQVTGYNKGTLYRLTSSREIPHYKIGGKLRFKRSELEQWLCSMKIPTRREVDCKAETYIAINSRKRIK